MIWIQGFASLALWILIALQGIRKPDRVSDWVRNLATPKKVALSATLYVIPSGFMAASLVGIDKVGGVGSEGLVPWAWAMVTFIGSLMVRSHVVATLALLSLAEDRVTPSE